MPFDEDLIIWYFKYVKLVFITYLLMWLPFKGYLVCLDLSNN